MKYKVEVTIPTEPVQKKIIEMEFKNPIDIVDCEIDKIVSLTSWEGRTYNGLFMGMDGDEIIKLRALSSEGPTLGFNVGLFVNYLEEIK